MANSKSAQAAFSKPAEPEIAPVERDEQVITPDDVATVTTGRILGPNALDGLPTVDPDAAAGRAVAMITARGYGPKTQAVISYIAERAVDTADLNVVILEQLAERLLNATNPQDILTPFDPRGCEDYLGQPIEIQECNFLESDFSDGFPWYASLRVRVLGTGEETVITVGGEKVMYQVAGFDMHGAWPQVCMIRKATKPSKAGYYPLDLRPAA